MFKKAISVIVAVIVTATGLYVSADTNKAEQSTVENTVLTVSKDLPYIEYKENYASYKNSASDAVLKTAISNEGVSLTEIGNSVTFEFTVSENAWFEPEIEYTPIESTGGDIELGLTVDGKSVCSQLDNILLPRVWENNSEAFPKDVYGDEYSPEQVEVFKSQKKSIKDAEGFITEPLQIALTKGVHKVSLTLKNEKVKINGFKLKAPKAIPAYKEYAEKLNKENYKGESINIEAETAQYKNQKFLIPLVGRNEAEITPIDPYKKQINYIGGTNWNKTGSAITWEIDVPKSGFYSLTFHFKQTYLQESSSYRELLIDGEIPFSEAKSIAFPYKSGWQYLTLADKKGKEMPVYLTEGTHTLTLSVTLGDMAQISSEIRETTLKMGEIYRKIFKITGENPDSNRDYSLFEYLPELDKELTEISEKLENIANRSEEILGSKGGSSAQIVRKAKITVDKMLAKKYQAHIHLNSFHDNYSSLSSWLYEMQNMALDLDSIILSSPETKEKYEEKGFFYQLGFSLKRVISTFMQDYRQSVSSEDSITIWSNWGRDQLNVLMNLISEDFTPKTGIKVNLKITAANLIQAGLSGNGPDLEINLGRTEPLNYAMRGILTDVSKFDDYNEITKRFSKMAMVPYEYNGGVYAIPGTETFSMLFVRTDIFEEMGIAVPKTWDEFIVVAKILSLNNMECGMPSDAMYMFMSQMGVPVYSEDRMSTNLQSAGAVEAITYWTDFYTKYNFPVSYDFFNRFRIGLMPMGIANYSIYATIKAAAPEINGCWQMFEVPGMKDENGQIKNTVIGSGTASVIMDWSEKKEKAWEFIKWWSSEDIQYRFGANLEAVLGVSARYETANLAAAYRFAWDAKSLSELRGQFDKLEELPEVPGGYYVSRSVQQVFWNVVNSGQNVEKMLRKWIPEADDEIRRKTEEYSVSKED